MPSKRGWLNPKHGFAAYQWTCSDYMREFEIRDCSRAVRLEFSDGSVQAARRKVDRLIKALQEFRAQLK